MIKSKTSELIKNLFSNKELLLVALSQIIGLITSVIFIKLVSIYADVSEYGLYSLVLSITAFVALFPFTPFDQAVGRYISTYHDNNTYAENYTNILWIYFISMLIILFIFLVCYPFIKDLISEPILKILNVVIAFTVLNIFRTTILQIENFNRNRLIVLYSRIFEGIGRLVFVGFVILYTSLTAETILLISCAIFLINILWILFYRKENFILKGLQYDLVKSNLKSFYEFSMPLLIWAVFSWLQLYTTIWALQYFATTQEVGYFNLINTIAVIIPAQLVGIIGTFIVPIMYQNEKKNFGYTKEKTKQILIYLSLIFSGIFFIMLFAHQFIVGILASDQYIEYSWILPYLFLAASLSNIAVIFTYEFFVYKKTKELLPAQIIPSIIGVICAVILIQEYKILGALYTMLIISLSYLVIMGSSYYKYLIKGIKKCL